MVAEKVACSNAVGTNTIGVVAQTRLAIGTNFVGTNVIGTNTVGPFIQTRLEQI